MAEKKEVPKRLRYYSKTEVAQHHLASDCWVSFFGNVYDLTPLIAEHRGVLTEPIVKFAGHDISDWFDPKTRDPRTYIDPTTCAQMPFCPHGRYVHIPPALPTADYSTDISTPWWRDEKYLIGYLSKKMRKIIIVNMLTGQQDALEVCTEETLNDIRDRYLSYNKHAHSYTWKRMGRPLDMSKTLDENGIPDESQEYAQLRLDEELYVPTIHVYFNDDLTVD